MSSPNDGAKNFELQVLCKNIQSTEKSVRQLALKNLSKIVCEQNDDDKLKSLLDQTYLHLIKCYADPFESTRCLAISTVSQFLNGFEQRNEYFLDYILPTIRRRIGLPELIEESEEIQLQLLQQVHEIVDKFQSDGDDLLMRSYNDIIDIVARNLINKYANAHRQSCEVIKVLATATPSFRMRAESLVDPLIELLSHRQSASRTLAVQTLGNHFTWSLNLIRPKTASPIFIGVCANFTH